MKLYRNIVLLLTLLLLLSGQDSFAMGQTDGPVAREVLSDSAKVILPLDSVKAVLPIDSVKAVLPMDSAKSLVQDAMTEHAEIAGDSATVIYADSLQKAVGDTLDLNRFADWKPDPIRAMWLGMVFPGGGQIYNRKYWKLPIVYGGVVGCMYALTWNAQMLRDYSQAYQDITDNDPTTNSHLEMLPLGYNIAGREQHFISVFKRKKDFYRRYRDLSIFCIAGVYLLSIIDAYVDAELSTFDIGEDLSLNLSPKYISSGFERGTNTFGGEMGISLQLSY